MKLVKLFVSIIICQIAATIGAFFTTPEINSWYKYLKKPFFNPPNWIFAPVWTILFVLMGVSLYLVWIKEWEPHDLSLNKKIKAWNPISQKLWTGSWKKANIVLIFALQLFINVLWSVIFFGMHSPVAGFFVILMLWMAILFTIMNFYRVSKTAAWLLVPYILWVSFAGVLNLFIFILN